MAMINQEGNYDAEKQDLCSRFNSASNLYSASLEAGVIYGWNSDGSDSRSLFRTRSEKKSISPVPHLKIPCSATTADSFLFSIRQTRRNTGNLFFRHTVPTKN